MSKVVSNMLRHLRWGRHLQRYSCTRQALSLQRRQYVVGRMDGSDTTPHDENEIVAMSPFDEPTDPNKVFQNWLSEIQNTGSKTAHCFTLSTIHTDSLRPASRMISCFDITPDGQIIFCTNKTSDKAKQINVNPHCSLVFDWSATRTSVRMEGIVTQASDEYNDQAWKSRNRSYWVYALTTTQCNEIENIQQFEKRYNQTMQQYENVEIIPRPQFWGAYLVTPSLYEFWKGVNNGCHHRFRYKRDTSDKPWILQMIEP